MKTIPDNIALAVGLEAGDAVEKVLKSPDPKDSYTTDIIMAHNLAALGKYFKIKIWFTEPVKVYVFPYKKKADDGTVWKHYCKKVQEHIFSGFFLKGYLYYKLKVDGRKGYRFDFFDKIEKWEIVLKSNKSRSYNSYDFKDYEAFKRKFDPRFITEDEIKKLWNSKSGQHGERYNKKDFHRIGPRGLEVMKRFLTKFKNVTKPDKSIYRETSYGTYLSERYDSYHHAGRDISISHNIECPYVHYSSEYSGCGNGRYGLVANPREFLWLEDD